MASATVGNLRAVLSADTGEFTRAMAVASGNVRDLAASLRSDLEPRQRAVNAAVKDFLGGNEVRRAEEYVIAVGRIGGATQLVESDQRKVNRAILEALEHYEKLGEEAPKAMVDLEKATRGVDTPIKQAGLSADGLLSSLRNAASIIGISFSVGAIVGFANKIFDTASNIKDMASALGWSAEALQRAKFAAEQSGGSFSALESAVNKLNINLSEGDKSTVAALKSAGLELDAIRALRPDEAFLQIADAVGRIEDPMARAEAAQALFGKGAKELVPGMIEGYRKLGESATVMSDETVARLEAAQDSWDRFKSAIVIYSGEVLGEIMRVWGEVVPALWVAAKEQIASLAEKFLDVTVKIVGYVQAVYQDIKTWMLDKFISAVVVPTGLAIDRIRVFFRDASTYVVTQVQNLYQGVKTWLVDRFTAVVDAVKAKVDAVTGFFGDMYDKVVGRSFVPEMVALIAAHFGKLDSVMVKPTGLATAGVLGHFKTLNTEIGTELGNLINQFTGPGGFGDKITNFASDFARGFTSTALNILVPGLGTLVNAAWPVIEMGLSKIWDGIQAFWRGVQGLFNFFGQGTGPQTPSENFNPNDPNNPFYGREDPGNPNPTAPLPEGGDSGDLYVPSEGLTPYEEYLRQRKIVYGYATGTGGRFRNFGRASLATLHGYEAVVPTASVPTLAEQIAAAWDNLPSMGSYGAAMAPAMGGGVAPALNIVTKVYLDGRQIAEATVPKLGQVMERLRL